MAMTLATLGTLVRQLVGDPQGSTYKPEMYQDAINFACKEYAKKTGVTYIESLATLDTPTGLCTIPTAYMRVNRVVYSGSQLLESTFQFESMKNPAWQLVTAASPTRWVIWSGSKIKLTPSPLTTAPATIGYVEYPSSLTTDGMTVDSRIPDGHAEYLKFAEDITKKVESNSAMKDVYEYGRQLYDNTYDKAAAASLIHDGVVL